MVAQRDLAQRRRGRAATPRRRKRRSGTISSCGRGSPAARGFQVRIGIAGVGHGLVRDEVGRETLPRKKFANQWSPTTTVLPCSRTARTPSSISLPVSRFDRRYRAGRAPRGSPARPVAAAREAQPAEPGALRPGQDDLQPRLDLPEYGCQTDQNIGTVSATSIAVRQLAPSISETSTVTLPGCGGIGRKERPPGAAPAARVDLQQRVDLLRRCARACRNSCPATNAPPARLGAADPPGGDDGRLAGC
jgi:hypothetical protein